MTKAIIILLLSISTSLFSQKSTIKVKKEEQPQTIVLRDRPAYFKDSLDFDGLFIADYIKTNIRLPDSVNQRLVSGTVYVSFTIKESGELTNIKIIKGVKGCLACEKEAVRLFSNMPKWKPAITSNKPVASDLHWAVLFKRKD